MHYLNKPEVRSNLIASALHQVVAAKMNLKDYRRSERVCNNVSGVMQVHSL